jgi:hypothetical protein
MPSRAGLLLQGGCLLLSVVLVCVPWADAFARQQPIEHVVLLGLDGLARTQLRRAMDEQRAPHLKSLLQQSAYTWQARSVQPSVSYPNWQSILGGIGSPFHGVDDNDWLDYAPPVDPIAGRCHRQPNIVSVLRQFYPDRAMGAFYEWPTIGQILQPKQYLNVSHQSSAHPTDDESTRHAVQFLHTSQPLFTFLYFDEIDETGHAHGFGEQYDNAIAETDERVGRVLQALDKTGMRERTLIVVLSDHGRRDPSGKSHGWFTTGEMTTFWAVSGPGIRRGYELRSPVANYDAAATIMRALGKPSPLNWRGRAVEEAFEDRPVPVDNLPATAPRKQLPLNAMWMYVEEQDGQQVETCLTKTKSVSQPLMCMPSCCFDNIIFVKSL